MTTVLLDAGGVILDESEHEKVRGEIVAEVLGAALSEYSVSMYQSDIEEAVRCFCPKTYEYVFWKHLKNDIALFEQLYARYLETWQDCKPPLKLYSGIENEIREIARDFRMGIAGQYGREILSLLEQRSILDCFACRLTQEDFPITKPDPRYFEQIAQAFGVAPEECIMVGDRIDNDVIPAKQLGMRTILIRVGLHRNQQPRIPFEMPDVELDGVTGLAKAVRKLAKP
ncbi:MAG: HAD family hydrolase [Candidatus Zixiibacteriota bacterium]